MDNQTQNDWLGNNVGVAEYRYEFKISELLEAKYSLSQ